MTALLCMALLPVTGGAALEVPSVRESPVHSAGALAMLAEREEILKKQLESARGAARERARRIYRLSRLRSYDAVGATESSLQRARVLGLGGVALRRDIDEARLIEAELERVRTELRLLSLRAARTQETTSLQCGRPSFTVPVSGPLLARFGVSRHPDTGVLVFNPGVSLRAAPSAAVRAIGSGTVRRIAREATGTVSLVVAHSDGWTSVLTGLAAADVKVGAPVHPGDPVGTAPPRPDVAIGVELWQGPSPVDPAVVMKLP